MPQFSAQLPSPESWWENCLQMGQECWCNLILVLLAAGATAGLLLTDVSLTWFTKMLLGCSLQDWDNPQNLRTMDYSVCVILKCFKVLWWLWAASGSYSMHFCFPSPFRKRFTSVFHEATEAQTRHSTWGMHAGELGAWLEHRAQYLLYMLPLRLDKNL